MDKKGDYVDSYKIDPSVAIIPGDSTFRGRKPVQEGKIWRTPLSLWPVCWPTWASGFLLYEARC